MIAFSNADIFVRQYSTSSQNIFKLGENFSNVNSAVIVNEDPLEFILSTKDKTTLMRFKIDKLFS